MQVHCMIHSDVLLRINKQTSHSCDAHTGGNSTSDFSENANRKT